MVNGKSKNVFTFTIYHLPFTIMNIAIIVAAGSGTRFGAEKLKQFLEILGKPLIIHTLERFESCPSIDEIVLVLPFKEIENFKKTAEKFNLKKLAKTIAGGQTRTESVFNGLNSIDSKRTEIVAIHDGARPLVSSEEISRTIEQARETGAACLVAAVTDTIKEICDGKIVGTIDRKQLRRALTPQAFQFDILQRAFAQSDVSETATDECFLVEKLGYKVATVEGSAKNIKITAPEDFILAEILLQQF
jgi:2-C-methyl-D-erythritol 4-phosphate cytidylyltransferase